MPGYLRGLCFHGPYALVGLSKIRERHIFGGLPVQQRCEKLLCGVAVVDTRSGREAGFFEFTAGCEELYDVAFLPGVRRPMILNLQKPAAHQAITNPESCYWLRPGSEVREPGESTDGRSRLPGEISTGPACRARSVPPPAGRDYVGPACRARLAQVPPAGRDFDKRHPADGTCYYYKSRPAGGTYYYKSRSAGGTYGRGDVGKRPLVLSVEGQRSFSLAARQTPVILSAARIQPRLRPNRDSSLRSE